MQQVKVGSFVEHPPPHGSSWQLKVEGPRLHRLAEPPRGATAVSWPRVSLGSWLHSSRAGPRAMVGTQGLQHCWCSWCSGMCLQDPGRDQEDSPPQVHHHSKDTPHCPSGLSAPFRISWSSRTTPGSCLCSHLRLSARQGCCHLLVPHSASPKISCFGAVSLAAVPSGAGPHGPADNEGGSRRVSPAPPAYLCPCSLLLLASPAGSGAARPRHPLPCVPHPPSPHTPGGLVPSASSRLPRPGTAVPRHSPSALPAPQLPVPCPVTH